MTIADDDPRQKFEQVADYLRGRIEQGTIKPGQALDSVRALAMQFGISPTTVQKALAVLRDEGLVFTSGRGNYARDPKSAAAPKDAVAAADVRAILDQLEHVNLQLAELRDRVMKLENQHPRRGGKNQ